MWWDRLVSCFYKHDITFTAVALLFRYNCNLALARAGLRDMWAWGWKIVWAFLYMIYNQKKKDERNMIIFPSKNSIFLSKMSIFINFCSKILEGGYYVMPPLPLMMALSFFIRNCQFWVNRVFFEWKIVIWVKIVIFE